MAEEPSGRNWSTKTLARQLVRFLEDDEDTLTGQSTINDLLAALKSAIVYEEVGDSLDVYKP